jgi:archaellum component FlaC
MNLDDLKIRVHLKSSWDSDPKPKIIPRTEISFYALLSAVGSDESSIDIDRFAVYQDELAILAHGNLSDEEKNIDIDVTSNSAFHEWVLARLNNRSPISFHIRIDSTEEVREDDESNNEDEVPAALIIPITGKVGFTSALDANITSLYDMHEKNSDCPFIINGLGTWEPGSGWTTSDVTFSDTCVEHFSNGDLKAHNNVVHAGTTSGTLADRSVTIPQTNLDPSNGAQPSADISVTLPENYTYHLMNTEGDPLSRGSAIIPMHMNNSSVVQDYNDLTLVCNNAGFLHAKGIPFYYNAYEIFLNETDGLGGRTEGVRYVYDLNFAATDIRRHIGVQSNDIHFLYSETDGIMFYLNNNGITLEKPLMFEEGSGWTHFPQTNKTWNKFEVSVIQDELTSTLSEEHRFEMNSGCGECSDSNLLGNPSVFNVNSDYLEFSQDGSIMGRVRLSHSDPARWGLFNSSHGYSFSRNDTDNNGILYLPGYWAIGSGGASGIPVVKYLLGSRDSEVYDEHRMAAYHLYQFDTAAAQSGNYFFPGITVGPKIYRDANGQPYIGEGSNLSGNILRVAFGGPSASSHFYDIPGNIGNKYILRPAGMTGVFNTDAVPGPNIYGFDINLNRFAFALVNNLIRPSTWIDGNFDVKGKGDFSIQFDSMRLKCSGHVDGAHVVRNDNDNERFLAWQTPIELLSMDFKPNDPSLDKCVDQGRKLLIGNTVRLFALNEKLGMQAYWSPSGEPSGATITGKTGIVLDRPDVAQSDNEYYGFNMALNKDMGMKTPTGSDIHGWFELNGKVSVPFWESPDVNARIANKTTLAPEQSVIRPSGVDLSGSDNTKDNPTLASFMKTDGKSINGKYVWGNTGFAINLPVYYDSGRLDAKKHPQFIGHPKNDKYVIFEVNSGIDFIDPKATKISFGASADFEKIRALNVDLHVDVNDPDSVAAIDDFLCSIGSLCSHPVASVIDTTRSNLNRLNAVGSSGMERFIETAVKDAVEQSVSGLPKDPFERTSEALTEVYSLPEKTASVIIDTMQESTSGMLAPLTSPLDESALDIYQNVPDMLFDVNAHSAQLEGYSADLAAILTQLNAIDTKTKAAKTTIEAAKDQLNTLVDNFTQQSNEAGSAIDQIITQLQSNIDTSCTTMSDISANPLLHQVFGVKDRAQMVLQALDAVNLISYATQLSSIIGVDLDGIGAAQEQIQLHAQEMLHQLNDINTQLESALSCSSNDYPSMLNDAVTKLTTLKTNLNQTGNALNAFKNQMNIQSIPGGDSDGGYFGIFKSELGSIENNISAIISTVGNFKTMMDIARNHNGELTGKYSTATQASQIRAIMNAQMQNFSHEYTWVDGNMDSFVTQLRQKLRTPIDNIIAKSSWLIASKLNSVSALFPKYSAKQLKWMVVDLIMNTQVVEDINKIAYQHMSELIESINDVSEMAFDQVNHIIQNSLEAVNAKVNETIASATGKISGKLPLKSAKVDGYAKIAGSDLERLHIGAEWSLQGDSSESTSTYSAALDITSWDSNGKGSGCMPNEDASSSFDAIISVGGLPISIGGSDATIRKLYIGFMLQQMNPKGVFGGISLDGTLDFQAFSLYDIAFACGVGEIENYLGASAGAFFDDIQMKVAFLVGKTCNAEVLTTLDPQVAEFIELPNNVFNGAYVRGSASIPVWSNGCVLTVGVSADAGAWFLLGPPITIGGLVGGGAYGKALCIASLRGQVLAYAQKSGDSYSFGGEGFGVAGIGFDCDPATWTSVSRSRSDSWCGTGDASFKAIYKSGWSVKDLSTSAIH